MKILYSIFAWILGILSYPSVFAISELTSDELKDATIPSIANAGLKGSTSAQSGTDFLDAIFRTVRDGIFTVLSFIVVAVLIYLGAKLIAARGNPEEFSKALKGFVYAMVGMFFVFIAWALVKFITGIEIY